MKPDLPEPSADAYINSFCEECSTSSWCSTFSLLWSTRRRRIFGKVCNTTPHEYVHRRSKLLKEVAKKRSSCFEASKHVHNCRASWIGVFLPFLSGRVHLLICTFILERILNIDIHPIHQTLLMLVLTSPNIKHSSIKNYGERGELYLLLEEFSSCN